MRNRRDLALISAELQTALKNETVNVIAIGSLLNEAQAQLEHGEWLPWLKENFGSSVKTAENYMAAARLADKFETVSNLKLRPTALYLLGRELDDPNSWFDCQALEAIFAAAKTEWISGDRAREIAWSLLPPPEPVNLEITVEEGDDETADEALLLMEEDNDVRDVLDGPPPEVPPPVVKTVHDMFDQAVLTLTQLQTKSLTSFVATTHTPDSIRAVSVFLKQVADAIGVPRKKV